MATRIPLPGQPIQSFESGVNTGRGLFESMMKPVLAREQMQQQDVHHKNQLGVQLQGLEQSKLHHMQNFGIALRQLEMAEQLAPYQRANIEAQALYHKAQADQAMQEQQALSQFLQGGMGGGYGQPQMNNPLMNSAAQGQMPTNATPPSYEQVSSGFGGNKVHPAMAALVKKRMGYDPNELTPEEKKKMEFDQFVKKMEYKEAHKTPEDYTKPTKTTITQNQKIVNSANTAIPLIEDLIETAVPSAIWGKFTPEQRAKAMTKAGLAAEELMTIMNLPKEKESTLMVKQMTHRQVGESEEAFKKRLQYLLNRVIHQQQSAYNLLQGGRIRITPKQESTQEPAAPQSGKTNDPLGIL